MNNHITDSRMKDIFDEICSPEYQAQLKEKLKEECATSRYRTVLSLHDRFLSDRFWMDRSISGKSEHAQCCGYELWITPSDRDDRYALRIEPNMINHVPHEWGFDFDSLEEAREEAWQFVVKREEHMIAFHRKYGFGPYRS